MKTVRKEPIQKFKPPLHPLFYYFCPYCDDFFTSRKTLRHHVGKNHHELVDDFIYSNNGGRLIGPLARYADQPDDENTKVEYKIHNNIFRYFDFLEKTHNIECKETAFQQALTQYMKLSMHEWKPPIYQINNQRTFIIKERAFEAIINKISDYEKYQLGCDAALNDKILNPVLREIDLTKRENWPIILNELTNFGWGNFLNVENEIRIDYSAVPMPYIIGYLSTILGVTLEKHKIKSGKTIILIASQKQEDKWR